MKYGKRGIAFEWELGADNCTYMERFSCNCTSHGKEKSDCTYTVAIISWAEISLLLFLWNYAALCIGIPCSLFRQSSTLVKMIRFAYALSSSTFLFSKTNSCFFYETLLHFVWIYLAPYFQSRTWIKTIGFALKLFIFRKQTLAPFMNLYCTLYRYTLLPILLTLAPLLKIFCSSSENNLLRTQSKLHLIMND